MSTSAETPTISPFARSFFLTGATASGKTKLGVEIALALDAEIVSLDSMALYRGMDVGAAKPTLDERRGVPHHLIDVVDPCEEFSVAEYLKRAALVVQEIESRGRFALFVGGTPLYLKAALYGVFDSPGADRAYREQLREIAEREGREAVWRMLREVDRVAAERLHPNDLKRVTRALEVNRLTGRAISEQQTQFDAEPLFDASAIFILTWEREELYRRINERVDQMMAQGFLEETRALFSADSPPGPTASKAIGYRELQEVLEGETTLESAVERVKQLTRNYAKRQETWFRSLEKAGARRVLASNRSFDAIRDELIGAIRKARDAQRNDVTDPR